MLILAHLHKLTWHEVQHVLEKLSARALLKLEIILVATHTLINPLGIAAIS